MMHDLEKRSMYGLVLRVFAQLQSDSQVSLLQAVACLKPNDAAAILTACNSVWWEHNVQCSFAVASHLQMILWKLIGNCAVDLLHSCDVNDLLLVFSTAVIDTAVGPTNDAEGRALWQWVQTPAVNDPLGAWNEWSTAQLQLLESAAPLLTARLDESSTRHNAQTVIGANASEVTHSMRLWWIWQCLLAVVTAASTAEASLWVGSVLKLLRHLLQQAPQDQCELLTSSLSKANPSVAMLLLDYISKISKMTQHGGYDLGDVNSERLVEDMIKPTGFLDFSV